VTKFDNASTTVLKTTKCETEESAHSRARKTSEDASVSSESSDNEARKRRAEAAKIHRAKVMAQMNKMQKQFMDKNVVEMMDTDTASEAAASAMDVEMEESQSMNKRVATGKTKN
jgi:E3 ubiquitin-protein ligase UBR1